MFICLDGLLQFVHLRPKRRYSCFLFPNLKYSCFLFPNLRYSCLRFCRASEFSVSPCVSNPETVVIRNHLNVMKFYKIASVFWYFQNLVELYRMLSHLVHGFKNFLTHEIPWELPKALITFGINIRIRKFYTFQEIQKHPLR